MAHGLNSFGLARANEMEVGVGALVSRVLSEINLTSTPLKSSFTPQVIHFAKNSHSLSKDFHDRVFILDGKACQVHVFSLDDSMRKKTFFLTPQPSSYPVSMLISPDRSFLAILTETSAHVADISKTESLLHSKQAKIIAKLTTVFDSLSGDSVAISRLVRVRWHPYIPNLLVLLISDGRLILCRCICSSGGSLKFENELVIYLLEAPDHADKENRRTRVSRGLNLSEAMGAVCCDFDFGSPLFSDGARFSHDAPLRVPIYVICENGDILLVSASPMSINKPLVRFVRILPTNEDYYTFDFTTLICLRLDENENQPDIVCFANRAGRIFHGICLHIPPSVLLQSDCRPQGRGIPILFLIDSVDLELPVLDKSFEASMKHDGDSDVDSEVESCSLKLALVPSSYLWSHSTVTAPLDLGSNYFCLHDFGIHHVRIPWVNDLCDLYSSVFIEEDSNSNLLEKLRSNMCSVEYLLLTQSLSSQTYDSRSPGRAVIGLLPHRASAESPSDTDTSPAFTVVFPSKPEVVTVPLPCRPPSRSDTVADLPSVRCEQWVQSLEQKECKLPVKSSSSRPKESEFVKKCRRSLKAAESSRLPILSSLDDGINPSEPKIFRLFLNATDTLRISQLSQLAGLAASVCRFAEYVEGQLAAQSEEVAGLAAQREALQTHAARLADRHSRILERQEALNHRLSELARRIYSIDAGLTDAELEMSSSVQNLRDRLKSGLLGWLENIRLQYDHLVTRLREQQRASDGISFGQSRTERPRGPQSSPLSPAQVENLVTVLKAEGSEIDALVKAVEKLKLISAAATTTP
ncbi:Nuclear pore complex protein Nup88 [Echinococcus granulosus]|nr:Nuclear pore complex protein Nup88 [Echinococcus granulosus]